MPETPRCTDCGLSEAEDTEVHQEFPSQDLLCFRCFMRRARRDEKERIARIAAESPGVIVPITAARSGRRRPPKARA